VPKRIQLSRKKGYRKPEGAIVVSRPSRWGNPWIVQRDGGAWRVRGRPGWLVSSGVDERHVSQVAATAAAVGYYRKWISLEQFSLEQYRAAIVATLAGRDLACWCPLDQPCHADVLLELANGGAL
jgi:hypothetical protein